MTRKPSDRRHYREPNVALNLTPMMNLVALLIPVLLISIAFVQVTVTEAELPTMQEGPPVGPVGLNLRLHLSPSGYALSHAGAREEGPEQTTVAQIPLVQREVACSHYVGTRPSPIAVNHDREECKPEHGHRPFTVFDHEALHRTLVALKERYPGERSLILSAEDDVRYQALIEAMDTSRAYEHKTRRLPLFDRVRFEL